MKKIVMFPHGGSGNHGCEAIVRATKKLYPNNQLILFSDRPEEDQRYLNNEIEVKLPTSIQRKQSLIYWKAAFEYYILRKLTAFDEMFFRPVISECKPETILLSIGGDNYCYGDNEYIYTVNRSVRKRDVKTVLWGCSIGAENLTDRMRTDLEAYDLIVARESLSFELLKKINPNTVIYPDPAFFLPKDKTATVPDELWSKEVIGINMSPLVQKLENCDGITMENYKVLISSLINTTEYNIALIPHVVWDSSDDRKPLHELYQLFAASGRVFEIEDQNAEKLKYIISKCKYMIASRTHASIAAYSSCVPTLVIGYSVKAKGIAMDIFGTSDDFVLPINKIYTKTDLLNAFSWITVHDKDIREKLKKAIKAYLEKKEKMSNLL